MKKMGRGSKLFGTDGIRGRANFYPMTVEIALALGKSVAKVLKRHNGKHRVVIGKDTRLSCYMFESALVAGLNSMGVDTLMVGPFPTPGIAFITRAYRADAGIVISASHNPFHDNGIKIFSSEGYKLPDEVEAEMEKMIEEQDFGEMPEDHDVGRNKRIDDADGRYIEFVKATFPKGKNLKGIKVFLDCAQGATHRVAPAAFWELDAQVIVTGNKPDGLNINSQCGSLHPAIIQKGVIEHEANIGIALDGDGDRVILVDEKGHIVDGDTILAICAHDLKKRGVLKNNRVVATVMTNLGVLKYLHSIGVEVVLSQVGDRYVIQDMLAHDALIGGEQSGHMIFLEHNTTGDGMVCALQVLRIMIETESTLSELASTVVKFPQSLSNVYVQQKPPLEQLTGLQEAIKQGESELGDQGRILVRYSGTEMVCRVMVEGPKKHQVDALAKALSKLIETEIGVK